MTPTKRLSKGEKFIFDLLGREPRYTDLTPAARPVNKKKSPKKKK